MRFKFGDCAFDSDTREVSRGETVVSISPKAFALLELLIERRPNAVSKADIHARIWPDTFVSDANLANLVAELRESLGDDAEKPRIIRTVHRFGYAFQATAEAVPARPPRGTSDVVYRVVWADREIALAHGENLIGRDQDSLVWVDDASVSRRHARIVIDVSGARLEDLGSKNGTRLNGEGVERPTPLHDGDTLRLGSVAMIFRRFEAGLSTETVSRQ